MKKTKNLIILSTFVASLASCSQGENTSSSSTSTVPPIEVVSLKTALLAMNQNKNYTIEYVGELLKPHSYYFTETSISRHSKEYLETDISYYFDGVGSYQINYYDGKYVSSEYRLEGKTPWEYKEVKTMYGVATDYINALDGNIKTLKFTSKPYRISFLEMIGKEITDFVNLESLTANYLDDKSVKFTMIYEKKTYEYVAKDFQKTSDPVVNEFVNINHGKVLTLENDWQKIKTAFSKDNYCQSVYYFGETLEESGYIATNYFNPHYYFYSYYDSPTYLSGYIPINLPDDEVFGTYQFAIDGSTSPASLMIGSMVSDSRNIVNILNYPSHLYLWQNLQYFKKYDGKLVELTGLSNNAVQTFDSYTLLDFANNFDIDSAFSGQKPYALFIDYEMENDEVESCVFYYVFSLGGLYYMMPIPFFDFGEADSSLVDQAYQLLNDDA